MQSVFDCAPAALFLAVDGPSVRVLLAACHLLTVAGVACHLQSGPVPPYLEAMVVVVVVVVVVVGVYVLHDACLHLPVWGVEPCWRPLLQSAPYVRVLQTTSHRASGVWGHACALALTAAQP